MPARSSPSTWTRPSPDLTETRRVRARWLAGSLTGALLLPATLSGCFASAPQIISLQPSRDSAGVAADAPITVQFDRGVAPETVAGHFGVKPAIRGCNLDAAFAAGPLRPCRIVWQPGYTSFQLLHQGAVFAPDQPYTFTLRGGFSDPAGAVNTVDHHWDISTAAAPQVRGIDPGDGSGAVPVEAPLVVTFSEAMDAASATRAIRLDPPVPATRVVVNTHDPSRFVILPGRPLLAETEYKLSVAVTATDQHGQPLQTAVQAAFSTGGLAAAAHAVILARHPGEAASLVLLAALTPARPGEPPATPTLLESPRCPAPAGCGQASAGAPLYTYLAAALSPQAHWLAVVEQDQTSAGAAPVLLVLDAARETVLISLPGATLPSWSPNGEVLAFAQGAAVRLYRPAGGTLTSLPPGDPILAPPVWSRDGEQLLLDAGGPAAVEHVDLADAVVSARYPLPGLPGPSTTPVVSPDGSQVALLVSGPVHPGTWLAGMGANASPPRLLDERLAPVGWAGAGTLVAILRSALGVPGLVRVSIAGDVQIPLAHAPQAGALGTVVVSTSGRQLAYLAPDSAGVPQVFVENADGSSPQTLSGFAGGLAAAAVFLSG